MKQDNQEIRNALTNVRRAFRTLASYQHSMLSIAEYIKNRSGIKDARISGAKLFSNPIRNCQIKEDYNAKLKLFPDMWSWDFLYGYMFEYYLGSHSVHAKDGDKNVSVSIIQISDDGFLTSESKEKRRTDVDSYNSPECSGSWIIICVGFGDGWYFVPQIMTKEIYSPTPWAELAFQTIDYLVNAPEDVYINKVGLDGEECFFMAKKFPLEAFFDVKSIDNLLNEFGRQLKQETGLNLFNC